VEPPAQPQTGLDRVTAHRPPASGTGARPAAFEPIVPGLPRAPRLLGTGMPRLPSTPRRRLLIGDDDHDHADALCAVVELSTDWCVEAAYGLSDAMQKALAQPPQAVILDMQLPPYDGLEVADRLRQALPGEDLVFVAVTGSADYHALASNDDRFVQVQMKPADVPALLRCLEDCGFSAAH
jgi:CheY-like chemotaxis protein